MYNTFMRSAATLNTASLATVGIESTIITLTEKGFKILRSGIITQEDIQTVVEFDSTSEIQTLSAPGMLKSHYSPRKKMLIVYDKNKLVNIDKSKIGLISFTGEFDESEYKKIIKVSKTNDLKEYAINLFASMHSLEDDDEIEVIFAEAVSETGIGKAIMDRLKKAEFDWKKAEL